MEECKKHLDWDSDEWMEETIDNPKCPVCQQEEIWQLKSALAAKDKRIEELTAIIHEAVGIMKLYSKGKGGK